MAAHARPGRVWPGRDDSAAATAVAADRAVGGRRAFRPARRDFPANVYAAVEGLALDGDPAMSLVPRTLMQLVLLAATLTVLAYHLR